MINYNQLMNSKIFLNNKNLRKVHILYVHYRVYKLAILMFKNLHLHYYHFTLFICNICSFCCLNFDESTHILKNVNFSIANIGFWTVGLKVHGPQKYIYSKCNVLLWFKIKIILNIIIHVIHLDYTYNLYDIIN